jgi:hypothetical protein
VEGGKPLLAVFGTMSGSLISYDSIDVSGVGTAIGVTNAGDYISGGNFNDANSCRVSSRLRYNIPENILTVEDNSAKSFGVYPNPAEEQITVSYESEYTGMLQISVMTLHGKALKVLDAYKDGFYSRNRVGLSEIPVGYYVFMIRAKDKSLARQIVKL